MSDSSEYDNLNDWPRQCACMHSGTCDSYSSVTDEYDSDDESESDKSSSEDSESNKKNVFISIYKNKNHSNKNIISDTGEIQNYRKRYSQLPQKNVNNIKNIWGDVKVNIPLLGHVPLKVFDDDLDEKSKNKKKYFKKPLHVLQKKVLPNSCTSDSEQSDIVEKTNKSSQPEIKKENNVHSNITKSNNTTQIKNKNSNSDAQNKNQKRKPEIPEKIVKPNVSDMPIKAKSAKNIPKSNGEEKTVKTNVLKPDVKSSKEDKILKSDKNIKSDTAVFKKPASDNNIKSDTAIFKKPFSENNIKSSSSINEKVNGAGKNMPSNVTSQSQKNNVEHNSKKKQKKQKQKEKKVDNNKRDTSNSSSRDVSESSNKSCNTSSKNNIGKNIKEAEKPVNKKQISNSERIEKNKKVEFEESKDDTEVSEIEERNTSNDEMDLLTDTENMPTFIADIIKRKEKNNKKFKTKQTVELPTKNMEKKVNSEKIVKQEFSPNTKKRKPIPIPEKDYIFYSERFAEEGVEMILEDNLMGGLEYISEALCYNISDHRHYLNRCYCYLRINRPSLALADAQYVIQTCTNSGQLFIANLRAGQASFSLKKFQQAEMYLKEATRINPKNYHVKRELMRVKISHIVSMGFKEKDALLALDIYSSTLEAIHYLTDNNTTSNISEFKNNFEIPYDSCDDMIFSSDEDDKPNNFETLNRMLNYQPGKVKLQLLVAKPSNAGLVLSTVSDKNGKIMSIADVKRKVALNCKPISKQSNEKAVWVGNLSNSITDAMLKKKFRQFGNVTYVYRPIQESYAFINFEKSEDVTNTLINTSCHEIAGIKLIVRSALRQK